MRQCRTVTADKVSNYSATVWRKITTNSELHVAQPCLMITIVESTQVFRVTFSRPILNRKSRCRDIPNLIWILFDSVSNSDRVDVI